MLFYPYFANDELDNATNKAQTQIIARITITAILYPTFFINTIGL
jgi:hypothetical protein